MAASIGIRIALVRSIFRKSVTSAASSTSKSSFPLRGSSATASARSIRSDYALRHPADSSSSSYLRRELSSLLPLHSAVAWACLISKLPDDAVSFEDRFVNYLSPI